MNNRSCQSSRLSMSPQNHWKPTSFLKFHQKGGYPTAKIKEGLNLIHLRSLAPISILVKVQKYSSILREYLRCCEAKKRRVFKGAHFKVLMCFWSMRLQQLNMIDSHHPFKSFMAQFSFWSHNVAYNSIFHQSLFQEFLGL